MKSLIAKKLTEYFKKSPYPVSLAYLFGSESRGETTPLSDVDIAVALDEPDVKKRLNLYLPLLSDLRQVLETDRIELCYLEEDSNGVTYKAIIKGLLLYSSDEKKRIETEAKILNEYLERQEINQVRESYLRRRIEEGKMGEGDIQMIDRETVQERLDYIDLMLHQLKSYQNLSFEEFKKDVKSSHAALYELQTCLEAMSDIGNHFIAALGYRKPRDRSEIFTILGEEKIIPPALGKRLEEAIGLRNIIVHGYLQIVLKVVHNIILNNLGDIKKFSLKITQFLEKM